MATNSNFMKALQPDAALSKVVGSEPQPRTEVTKKIWAYIKSHDLQDTKNKRNINADAKLLPVFNGRSQINMFELVKLVGSHLK